MTTKIVFSKILVANRGEIAVRVIKTAKALGYRTVAVCSDADAKAPHVKAADFSVCIGAAPVGESYLVAEKILQAAQRSGADAIHPGYGFLSENADFARACEQAGIAFIGPSADAIELMGSKRLSKIAMKEASVPCIPGYEGGEQGETELIAAALEVGFPVMIKASAGGGGRGMRLVFEEAELAGQIRTARSEAQNAFGSGELILEKALIEPRHIEIQVFADRQGNAVYLGERDCSIQRRHQKVVEEAPSPFVDPELRKKMGECAVKAAIACNYVGAGTVEFLVDAEKNFYFLEMNTRLQVEHPVTELVTGTDLVAWQLNVAAGLDLPLAQDQIEIKGHAIEVRLYAEDPRQDFVPQTGNILTWLPLQGEGIRIDSGIESGQVVSPHYDPMLAKLIAYGDDREQARRRLIRVVEDSVLLGVSSNQEFLSGVLSHQDFASGAATTAFIENSFKDAPSLSERENSPLAIALATVLFYQINSQGSVNSWRNSNYAPWPYQLRCGDSLLEVSLSTQTDKDFSIVTDNETTEVLSVDNGDGELSFIHDGVGHRAQYYLQENTVFLKVGAACYVFDDMTHEAAASEDAAGSGKLLAVMDGGIVDVLVEAGTTVKKGETLVVLEAMKMEHQLKADSDGVVLNVNTKVGDQVKIRQLLIEIEPLAEPE